MSECNTGRKAALSAGRRGSVCSRGKGSVDGLYTSSSCNGSSCRRSGGRGGGILRIYPRSQSRENEKRALVIRLAGGRGGGRGDTGWW